MTSSKYSEEFKRKIVKLYNQGESVKSISENYSLPKSNIIAWDKKFQEIQINKYENVTIKEVIDLKKELQKLIQENNILIDLNNIYGKKDMERKIDFINKNKKEYSIKQLCEMLNISTSTYYSHVANKTLNKQDTEEYIEQIIKEVYIENRGVYGVNKMYFALRKRGIIIGRKKVQKIMRELNLYPITLR